MSGDVNDEIKGQIIDKAFEIIKENREIKDARNDLLVKYNHMKNEWEVIDIIKEIRKKVDITQN